MNKSLTKYFIAIGILCLLIWLTFFPARFNILNPRLGKPLILQAGDTFKVKIQTSIPYWPHHWQASIQSATDTIKLNISNSQTEFSLQTISLQLPENIKDNKYSLLISDEHKQLSRQGAIHIINKPKDSITIIQMADLPTLSASGKKQGDLQLKKIIQETNLINPDLVLFTGDLAYQGSWAQYYQLLDAMSSVNAPLIAAPGNHEYQGWSAFLTLLGKPYHTTEYGNYFIVSLNSGHSRDQLTYSQLKWLKKELDAHKNKTIIVQLHHSIQHRKGDRGYLKNNIKPLLSLFKQYNVSIVLSGHWHGDSLFDINGQLRNDDWKFAGTPFVVTTAAGAKLRKEYSQSPLHHGYRLIRFKNRILDNFTYDYDGDNKRDASSSIPYNKISVTHPDSYTAIVSNKLNESFENILLEFHLPPNNNKILDIKNGRFYKDIHQKKQRIIQVNSQLKANSKIKVELQMENIK